MAERKDRKVRIWAALIVGVCTIISAVIVAMFSQTPVSTPVVPPGLPQRDDKAIVDSVAQKTKQRIQGLIRKTPGLACRQSRLGSNGVSVRFYGSKDQYPLGKYLMRDTPRARMLADMLVDVNNDFEKIPTDIIETHQLDVIVFVSATADAYPMEPVLYEGPTIEQPKCVVGMQGISLVNNQTFIGNEELGCARAVAFVDRLFRGGIQPQEVTMEGSVEPEKDSRGTHRLINVMVTFEGILSVTEPPDFCSR